MGQKFQGDVLVKNDLTVNVKINLPNETPARAPVINASGEITSSTVTETELGYISGVTSAIQTQLDAKLDDFSSANDNRLVRTDGTSGDAIQESGITIDDSDNVTGMNNLTLDGDLTVNGTTTSVQSTTLEVADANIIINDGGTQASADAQDAGLTVEMSDATDVVIGYDSTLASRWKIGDLASEQQVVTVGHTQTLTNKTLVAASNTITTAASGNLTSTELNAALAELQTDIDTRQLDVVTTQGDIIIADGGGSAARLALGGNNTVLQSNGTTASWVALATTDERVKISSNDTTEKYLEDCLVFSAGSNTTNILESSTLNDGADEDLQIQIDVSKIDHDSLLNFVANEHVDHSSVLINTNSDSGLTGGGDLTASRTLLVDIAGTTAETSADDADSILIQDNSAGALREMTRANFLSGLPRSSSGDLDEDSFSLANNQLVAANVTGLVFPNGTVRSFKAHVSVEVDATVDLFETYELMAIQKGASWDLAIMSVGDESLVVFDITAAGQITYTSGNYAGFVSGTVRFRAITTSV